MMKTCPFCGSPAAAWPEYASDYVRGYSLCEHHMKPILESATVKDYEPARLAFNKRWSEIENEISEFMYELCERYNLRIDDCAQKAPGLRQIAEDECAVMDCAFIQVMDSISECPVGIGAPVKIYIDEHEVDRLVALRIKSFARDIEKGFPMHRCSVERDGLPDNRCINRAERPGGSCKSCKRNRRDEGAVFASKLDKIMEIIRDD